MIRHTVREIDKNLYLTKAVSFPIIDYTYICSNVLGL